MPRNIATLLSAACTIAISPAVYAAELTEDAAGKALYNGVVMLCGDALGGYTSLDDAEALANYGFVPGTAEDEAELRLNGVQGELISRELSGAHIQVAAYAPETCVARVYGTDRFAAGEYLQNALELRHEFALVSGDAVTAVLQAPARRGRVQSASFFSTEGAEPFLTINMSQVDMPAAQAE